MLKKIFLLIALISLLSISQPVLASSFGESLNQTAANADISQSQNLTLVVAQIVQGVLGILGVIFLVLLIYGGFVYMTSMSDAKKIEKAKNIIKAAIIGLIIVLAAYSIAFFVANSLESATQSQGSSTPTSPN